jgi:hypothetical protein
MAEKIITILSSMLLIFAYYPNALRSQIAGSGLAKVMAEILPVRSENFPTSQIVKVLKKGDLVRIQMEIIGSGGQWCLISEETEKIFSGFVPCEDLGYVDRNSNIAERIGGKQEMMTPPGEGLGSLLQAIWKGDVVAVQELIEKGVDPNAQTKLGISPLRMAAKKQETEITHLLIAKGADVNAGDQNGKTPLMEAASAGRPANAKVLLSAGAKVNAIDENGFTALMWATMLGFPEIVEILLESGAEVNARSKDARTAMGICQKLVENTTKSLARAFKSNSEVSELQIRLANHTQIFQILKEAGGRE